MISIRRNLILVIVATMTLVSFYASLQGYRASMAQANQLFDSELSTYAASLKMAADKQGILAMPEQATIAFQVFKAHKLVYRSDNAPTRAIAAFKEGYADKNFARYRWRTLSAFHPDLDIWVIVAQRSDKRFELAERITLASVYPTVLSLPLMAVLIWLIISRGLRPLREISAQLGGKKADELAPLQVKRMPLELKQVVETVNDLLYRLDEAFLREKRFASDAAHELKTPLSVLKINAYNLSHGQAGKEDIAKFNADVERMSHVIDQILTLYRTNEQQFDAAMEPIDLYAQSQQIIAELYPQIDEKHQQIELVGEQALIKGQKFALRSMLVNLIANASKYTPDSGQILLEVGQNQENTVLTIEDSGPGIPAELQKRVFERFYRVGRDRHNSGIQGCGLGLSIVAQIVRLHHGTIELGQSRFDSGLKVILTFDNYQDELGEV